MSRRRGPPKHRHRLRGGRGERPPAKAACLRNDFTAWQAAGRSGRVERTVRSAGPAALPAAPGARLRLAGRPRPVRPARGGTAGPKARPGARTAPGFSAGRPHSGPGRGEGCTRFYTERVSVNAAPGGGGAWGAPRSALRSGGGGQAAHSGQRLKTDENE